MSPARITARKTLPRIGDQAGGIAEVLAYVRALPFGGIIYALIEVGLAAFGTYNFVEARFRRIAMPGVEVICRQLPLHGINRSLVDLSMLSSFAAKADPVIARQ